MEASSKVFIFVLITCCLFGIKVKSAIYRNFKRSSRTTTHKCAQLLHMSEKSQRDVSNDSISNSNDNFNVGELSNTDDTSSLHKFILGEDEIIISCTLTKFSNPSSTRLVPPVTWLTSSGSKVKLLHTSTEPITKFDLNNVNISPRDTMIPDNNNDNNNNSNNSYNKYGNTVISSIIEISVSRLRVDQSLTSLRMNGFQKEDIYRLFDKGPWILSFAFSTPLTKLMADLKEMGLTSSQSVHVISHCPFLLAQYCRYKGRDVSSTAKALQDVGYSANNLLEDIIRFPTILSSPPDRIRRWMSLLHAYNIGRQPGTLGKMMKRAPFMFYMDPPQLFDIDFFSGCYSDNISDINDINLMNYISVDTLLSTNTGTNTGNGTDNTSGSTGDNMRLDERMATQSIVGNLPSPTDNDVTTSANTTTFTKNGTIYKNTYDTINTKGALQNQSSASASTTKSNIESNTNTYSFLSSSTTIPLSSITSTSSSSPWGSSNIPTSSYDQFSSLSPSSYDQFSSLSPSTSLENSIRQATYNNNNNNNNGNNNSNKKNEQVKKSYSPYKSVSSYNINIDENKDNNNAGNTEIWKNYEAPTLSEISHSSEATSTSDGYVFDDVIKVLNLFQAYHLKDVDKIVRSQPNILLENPLEIQTRLAFLQDISNVPPPPSNMIKNSFYVPTYKKRSFTPPNINGVIDSTTSTTTTITNSTYTAAAAGSNTTESHENDFETALLEALGDTSITTENPSSSSSSMMNVEGENKNTLNSLLQAYPSLLSINSKSTIRVTDFLKRLGFRKHEVLNMIKKYPSIFHLHPEDIQVVISFLRYYCGFRKYEMISYLLKYPTILQESIENLNKKIDYLYETLNGDPTLLKQYPAYLHYHFEEHIQFRSEFLFALGFTNPLHLGIENIFGMNVRDYVKLAKIPNELYDKFKSIYLEQLKLNQSLSSSSSSSSTTTSSKNGTVIKDSVISSSAGNIFDKSRSNSSSKSSVAITNKLNKDISKKTTTSRGNSKRSGNDINNSSSTTTSANINDTNDKNNNDSLSSSNDMNTEKRVNNPGLIIRRENTYSDISVSQFMENQLFAQMILDNYHRGQRNIKR